MQLAYGKFDPDLNPIPFSDWSNALSAVEIDLVQYFQWKPKVAQYFQEWILRKDLKIIPRVSLRTQREVSEYEDLFQIWNERFSKSTLYFSIYSGRKKWEIDLSLREIRKLPTSVSCFFEWAQEDRIINTTYLLDQSQFAGFVLDPHWHQRHFPKVDGMKLRFKLHGWHEERWMRRYGVPLITKISRSIQKAVKNPDETSLVLSYSGKTEEAPLFA